MLTYLKSSISSRMLKNKGALSLAYYRILRPAYIKFAAGYEAKQWKKMNLELLSEDDIRSQIRESLANRKPFTLAKIGATEYFMLRWFLGEKVLESRLNDLHHLSGVFPCEMRFFQSFAESYAKAVSTLDILGIWTGKDEPGVYQRLGLASQITNFSNFSGDFTRIAAGGPTGWFPELRGYRVLVISSFADQINARANKNDWNLYWAGRLPWMEPASIQAVPFPYGFDPSTAEIHGNSLKLIQNFKELHQKSLDCCDVVLLGCGAYAIPLLEWIRSNGKVGIHMGGDIQLLFGIRGGRWDNVKNLYNEHWTRPEVASVPRGAEKVENSCYW